MKQVVNIPSTSRPRVLFLAPQPFFVDRGSPMRVRSTVTGLVELGYEVDLLAYPVGSDIQSPGLQIFRSAGLPGVRTIPIGPSWVKIGFDALLGMSAISRVLRNRYDVIHGVEEAAYIAAPLARFKRIPYIFDMHSWVLEHLEHSGFIRSGMALRVLGSLERRAIRRAGGVITVGDEITEMARRVAPKVPGCSLPDLPLDGANQVAESDIRRIREEFKLDGKRTLLYTGNFAPYQGVDLLLRSFAKRLRQSTPGDGLEAVRLLIVGGGGQTNADYVRSRALAKDLGIDVQTIFAGQRPETDMGAFMAAADVLVSPRTEGTNPPLKIYSYMAAARPILATRIRSHTQVLGDHTAILADATEEALADGLQSALDQSPAGIARRAACVAAAKALAETVYCRKEFLRRLRLLYLAARGLEDTSPSDLEQDWDEKEARLVAGAK